MKTISQSEFEQALNYLISEYGLFSDPVNLFFQLGKTDEAITYACNHGFQSY